MARFSIFTCLLAIVALTSIGSARKCRNMTIPITISSRNGVFNQPIPANNIDVTDFILNLSQQGHNHSNTILTGYATVAGTYDVAATYCEPDSGSGKVVQLLTHGIGFDRSYWDLSANNYNYSYVQEAVDQYGYSTLSHDRLGIGMSQHGEPLNEIQSWLEVAALKALTMMLREGQMSCTPEKFEKVIHVGHSFGSIESYTLAADDPSLSDGLILQGFSQNSSFVPFFELGGNFVQANGVPALSAYPNGYLAAGDESGVQTNFFAPGDFDPAILDLAYMTGEPVTLGELLTLPAGTGGPSTFAGPVLVITGERDIPFCGGDCLATGDPSLPSIPASSAKFLTSANVFEAFIVPGAGHGLNLQYSHTVTYGTMLNFLVQNGLSA